MGVPMSRVRLTAGRVSGFACPPGRSQAFLWDSDTPSLALRATPSGRKTFVFESRLHGATVRINIGAPADWPIELARTKAQGLKVLVDSGEDPRELEREKLAAAAAKRKVDEYAALTVAEAWSAYVAERRPVWGELHYRDHLRKAGSGGEKSTRGTRGTGITRPGPLFPLMSLPLRDLDASRIEAWAAAEAKTRATSARLAWRLLKVFLRWCSEQPAYAPQLPDKNPAMTTKTREALGKVATKADVLQKSQLKTWFEHVRKIQNPTIAAALQVMLLTGARPGEVLTMQWADVNTKWKGLTIRDKVEGRREIPLTPYVASLLAQLPHANDWVFASVRWVTPIGKKNGEWKEMSTTGHIADPNGPHTRACIAAGLEELTLHGLRRSFKSLTEWLDVPAGVVAQLMGHKPSATAEKHYTVRPLDLLRVHHERIEAWILEQSGIKMPTPTERTLQAIGSKARMQVGQA